MDKTFIVNKSTLIEELATLAQKKEIPAWESYDVEMTEKYYIDYGTGAGNEQITGTLEDAKKAAVEGARYTQTDITILLEGEVVACLAWSDCRIDVDDEDIEVVKDFGDFGFYSRD